MAEPHVAAYAERAEHRTRPTADVALDLVVLVALVALAAGVGMLSTGNLAWDREAAIDGVIAHLPETVPAAVLALGATALNLAAGGVLARLAVGAPFAGPARALVAATAGTVLLDTTLLFVLGWLGLFRAPLLIAVHLAILAVGWRTRPWLAPGSLAVGMPRLLWALVAVAWLGAVVVQLASPVVPFIDVLPNHVAPAERLRTFGEFGVLTESPSPIYGPSRTFLGYVALLGTITTLTGLPAGLAASAFILPSSLLVAVGVHRLATSLGGTGAGLWGLIAFTLTASFGRLTDARATVIVLPVALGALAFVVERLTEPGGVAPAPSDDPDLPRRDLRAALLVGSALGAAVLVHPVVGALTVVTVGVVALMRSDFAPLGVPAVAAAGALALPQAATMLGFALPSVVGLVAVVPAVGLAWALSSPGIAIAVVLVARAALLAVIPFALASAGLLVGAGVTGVGDLVETMPLLTIGAAAGLALAPRAAGHPVVVAGLVAGVVAAAVTQAVPQGEGLLTDAIRFELPKTLHYWLPVFAALATGLGLHALWRRADVSVALRAGLIAVFLVVAVLPLRSETEEEIDDHHLGEHRLAETLAVDLRWAGRGYWRGYPDARRVVDAPRQELLTAIRDDVEAGRIDDATDLLHVAPSFQQWVATPFGVFTGIRETVVSPDSVESIHTVGGRLRPPDALNDLLAEPRFSYAVLEPGEGVPADARDRIVAAGFSSIFANGQGEVFARR